MNVLFEDLMAISDGESQELKGKEDKGLIDT